MSDSSWKKKELRVASAKAELIVALADISDRLKSEGYQFEFRQDKNYHGNFILKVSAPDATNCYEGNFIFLPARLTDIFRSNAERGSHIRHFIPVPVCIDGLHGTMASYGLRYYILNETGKNELIQRIKSTVGLDTLRMFQAASAAHSKNKNISDPRRKF